MLGTDAFRTEQSDLSRVVDEFVARMHRRVGN
ncbi:MAG: hypothetical protein ACI9ME_000645 [Ilumatobacter sp.]|jgi:hypothetical protein